MLCDEEKGKEKEMRKREDTCNDKELAACAYLSYYNCHGDIRMAVASGHTGWQVPSPSPSPSANFCHSGTISKQLSWYSENCHYILPCRQVLEWVWINVLVVGFSDCGSEDLCSCMVTASVRTSYRVHLT
jgi:hypothetical protein